MRKKQNVVGKKKKKRKQMGEGHQKKRRDCRVCSRGEHLRAKGERGKCRLIGSPRVFGGESKQPYPGISQEGNKGGRPSSPAASVIIYRQGNWLQNGRVRRVREFLTKPGEKKTGGKVKGDGPGFYKVRVGRLNGIIDQVWLEGGDRRRQQLCLLMKERKRASIGGKALEKWEKKVLGRWLRE